MRRASTCLIILSLAACSGAEETPDKAPGVERPVEGTWDARVRVEEAAFIEDTLELLSGGTGFAHRRKVNLSAVGSSVDTSVYDFKRQTITWEVVSDSSGRSLCVTGQNGPQRDCGQLAFESDSVMLLGNFRYRLIRPAKAP